MKNANQLFYSTCNTKLHSRNRTQLIDTCDLFLKIKQTKKKQSYNNFQTRKNINLL